MVSVFRFGWRTTCSWATVRARLWPCLLMISGTLNLPASLVFPSGWSSNQSGEALLAILWTLKRWTQLGLERASWSNLVLLTESLPMSPWLRLQLGLKKPAGANVRSITNSATGESAASAIGEH